MPDVPGSLGLLARQRGGPAEGAGELRDGGGDKRWHERRGPGLREPGGDHLPLIEPHRFKLSAEVSVHLKIDEARDENPGFQSHVRPARGRPLPHRCDQAVANQDVAGRDGGEVARHDAFGLDQHLGQRARLLSALGGPT